MVRRKLRKNEDFWHPDGNLGSEPEEYRLRVHVFGAVSSPSCANYALQRTGQDSQGNISEKNKQAMKDGFYVCDFVKSTDTVEEARALWQEAERVCSSGKFNLTQVCSSHQEVLTGIDQEKSTKGIQNRNLGSESALGIKWKVSHDQIGFKVSVKEQPATKRAVLSTIHGIFDPFGLISPALLRAKFLFQELCRTRLEWDEALPEEVKIVWMKWLKSLPLLETYT